jgi:hypothetical protein
MDFWNVWKNELVLGPMACMCVGFFALLLISDSLIEMHLSDVDVLGYLDWVVMYVFETLVECIVMLMMSWCLELWFGACDVKFCDECDYAWTELNCYWWEHDWLFRAR